MQTPRSPIVPVLAAFAGSALAQLPCLDQSHLPMTINGLEVTANQSVTQTFTVGRAGQLARVDVAGLRHHSGITTNPLRIDLVTTDTSGVPTATVLASVSVPPSSIPTAYYDTYQFDVTAANVQVQVDDVFGIAVSSPNPPNTPRYIWLGEVSGGTYPHGQVFGQQTVAMPAVDMRFRTWVEFPASSTSYGAGYPGTAGVPNLTSSALPVLGTAPLLSIGNPAGAPTMAGLFYGSQPASLPTPFGGTGLVQAVGSLGYFVPAGGAQVPISIPNNYNLCGVCLYLQAVVVDAGATFGLAFTPGLEWLVSN